MGQPNRVLMIMEVSRKQDYIFASTRLRENIARSLNIKKITESPFLEEASGGLYRKADNLVNTGGGHAVLQFPDGESARQFARRVTRTVMERYPGLELFVKMLPYRPELDPGKNMRKLTDALEEKKARRNASFFRVDTGINGKPAEADKADSSMAGDVLPPPDGCAYPKDIPELNRAMRTEKISGHAVAADNFIAVVHVDGNAMGARVGKLYEKPENRDCENRFENCKKDLQNFSCGIEEDFKAAFSEMAAEVKERVCPGGNAPQSDLPDSGRPPVNLPLRPVILAGDDVCFVSAGSIGLECARIFLEKLSQKTNCVDHQPYSACAGVALVHEKYPFHRAYRLAEELCENAKRFGAQLDEKRRVSAMDWHIEFGQLQDSLAGQRQEYETGDSTPQERGRLELRPVTVVIPPRTVPEELIPRLRSYEYFSRMCRSLQGEYGKIARGKIKGLRLAMKQGAQESAFYLRSKEIGNLLYHPFHAVFPNWEEQVRQYRKVFERGATVRPKEVFAVFSEPDPEKGTISVRRSLFFDAIEMIDHFEPLETSPGEETV